MLRMHKILPFVISLFAVTTCLNSPQSNQQNDVTTGSSKVSEKQQSLLYWTGDGGKGKSITILPPKAVDLATNQTYLPDFVANELVSNFNTYSGMTLFDRVSNQRQYNELLSGLYADNDEASKDMGHLASTDYMLLGSITKTSTGYALQLTVNKNIDKTTVASYSGNVSIVELDNLIGIRRASLDLLQKLGIMLTNNAKVELAGAASTNHVNAQTALARGVTAQRQGTDVAALNYYYEAATFDPSLIEAAKRASVMSSAITSGNIGENVRNDIQHRNEWLKIINEATAFFKAQPPYEIVYDPALTIGIIDYEKEVVDIYCNAGLRAQESGFKVIRDLAEGLKKTKKVGEWGLANWPNTGVASIFSEVIQNYRVNARLTNENGQTLGNALCEFKGGNLTFSHDYGILRFINVNANLITDNLTITIISVNGISINGAGGQNNIRISSENIPDIFDWESVKDGRKITGYQGSQTDIVIPSVINGSPVTTIGKDAFNGSNRERKITSVVITNSITRIEENAFAFNALTNITLPNNVTYIGNNAFAFNLLSNVSIGDSVSFVGNSAFASNQLTTIVIPDNVTAIGDKAFSGNRLTRVTIGNSVTTIGVEAFRNNPLSSVTIGNSVTSIGKGAFEVMREDGRSSGSQLTSIVIPNSVTKINANAFFGNPLLSIIIGSNITIDTNAFYSTDWKGYGDDSFTRYYQGSDKKAGRYTRTNVNSDWTYNPR